MSTPHIQKSGGDLAALKLYYLPISAHSRRVAIYLREKGIDLQFQEIDGANYAHKSPEFLAINPAGKVPVLQMRDGRFLPESAAIIEYLEELYPDPPLLGTNPEERARIRALERIANDLGVHLQVLVQHTQSFFAKIIAQIPEAGEVARREINTALRVIGKHLGNRAFLAGDSATIADCTLFALLDTSRKVFDLRFDGETVELNGWYRRFAARPSAAT